MGLFDWFDELKCQHEYKYIGSVKGYNFCGVPTIRKYYQCKKCLKTKYIDYAADEYRM